MLRVLLSALAVNAAFFFPGICGWLVLLFWVPLVLDRRLTFTKGFVWGLAVFGPHFGWLAVLLVTKSQAPVPMAVAGYAVVVAYFSLTSGVWFAVLKKSNPFFFFALTTAYYWFIENYSLLIFGRAEGYPFINPLIPLVHYPWVAWLVAKAGELARLVMFGGALVLTPVTPGDVRLVYVSPVPGPQTDAVAVGQRVYHKLARMTFPPGAQPLIIVTPESFYQFSLNRHEEQVALWTSAIPDDAHLIVGTQATDGRKMYQVAALAQAGLIKKYYVKHHCVPFTEKIPKFWRRMTPLRNFFLHNADEFSKGKSPLGAGVFDVGAGVRLIPQVCSEFFFKLFSPQVWHVCREQQGRRHALLLLVNDSWFVGYFQRIIKALTALKAAYLGIPVIYVGHTECRWYGGAGGV